MTHITEKQVDWAIHILADKDGEMAKARAAHEYQSDMTRVIKAKLMMECEEKSQGAKEAYAYAHPEYERHLGEVKTLAEMDYRHRDKKTAASAVLDLWRTEQSNARASEKMR